MGGEFAEGELLAQTNIAFKATELAFCHQKLKDMLRDVQVMIVTQNPQNPATLQPAIITFQTLASGLAQTSKLISQQRVSDITALFRKLKPLDPPQDYETVRTTLDLTAVIAMNNLQKDDVIILLSVTGKADHLQRALAGLRDKILLASLCLAVHRKSRPWLLPHLLNADNLQILEKEINELYSGKSYPVVAQENALLTVKALHDEIGHHRQLPGAPFKWPLKYGSSIY